MLQRMFFVLLISLFSIRAEAATVELLDRPIEIIIPSGYCEVGGQPEDKEIVNRTKEAIGINNQVLALFADCKELKEFRKGKRAAFDNYGQILAQTPKGQLRAQKDISRDEYIKKIGGSNLSEACKKAQARAKQYIPGYQNFENLGVLSTDSNGIYVGLLMSMTDDTGKIKPIVGIVGITLVKELPISINLYQAYKGSPNLQSLLTLQKTAIANFVRKNN